MIKRRPIGGETSRQNAARLEDEYLNNLSKHGIDIHALIRNVKDCNNGKPDDNEIRTDGAYPKCHFGMYFASRVHVCLLPFTHSSLPKPNHTSTDPNPLDSNRIKTIYSPKPTAIPASRATEAKTTSPPGSTKTAPRLANISFLSGSPAPCVSAIRAFGARPDWIVIVWSCTVTMWILRRSALMPMTVDVSLFLSSWV